MLTQKEINQYINCVKKNYNGPYKIKKRFLDELTQAISEFTSDNPDAALKDLENQMRLRMLFYPLILTNSNILASINLLLLPY